MKADPWASVRKYIPKRSTDNPHLKAHRIDEIAVWRWTFRLTVYPLLALVIVLLMSRG